MKRSLYVFFGFVFLFTLLSVLRPISAYWTTTNEVQERSMGLVLGWQNVNSDSNYFYVAGPAPQRTAVSPTITTTPTPTITPSPTRGRSRGSGSQGADSSSSSASNTPAPQQDIPQPSSTPPQGSGGSNWQGADPTQTPTIQDNQPLPTDQSSSTSSTRSTSSQSGGPFVTSTPYPTRPSGLSVISTPGIAMPNAQDLINPPSPGTNMVTPTPIPDELRGGIFIVPTPTPRQSTTATVPAEPSNPVFVPGHEIASIEIKVPSRGGVVSPGDSVAGNIDIQVNRKVGEGVSANEEQFIIQKAMQRITISADSSQANSLSLSKNDVKARISMGIHIDPLTNTLTVDTPNGKQRVSIMPDDALNIIRELHLIEQNLLPSDIVLESHNGQLVYKIPASKVQKLLGLIPLTIPKDIFIAADTGGIVEIQTSAFYNFITLFTF